MVCGFARRTFCGSNARWFVEGSMVKWAVVVFLLVLLTGLFRSELSRVLRIGRLPGDFTFRLRGRVFHFPFTSTLLLSLLAWLILRSI
jgi:hypothetical protein